MSRLVRRLWFTFVALLIGGALSACKPKTAEQPPSSPLEQAKLLPAFDPGAGGVDDPARSARAVMARPPEMPEVVPAQLIDFGPEGDTDEYPSIQFVFSQAMVAFGDDDARTEIDPNFSFEIEPKVKGRLKWVSPYRMEYVTDGGLPRAQGYTVRASGTLTDTNGHAVKVDKSFEFATPRPQLDIQLANDHYWGSGSLPEVHWKTKVLVTSWWKFSSRDVQKKARAFAVDGLGRRVPVAIKTRALGRAEKKRRGFEGAPMAVEVSPETHWPGNREIVVEIDESLKSREGPLSLGSPAQLGFRTMDGLRIHPIECYADVYADGCEVGPVRVRFNTPMRAREIAKITSAETIKGFEVRPQGEVWDYYGYNSRKRRGWYDSALVWGDFKHGQTLTLSLEGAKDVYGQPQAEAFEESVDLVEPAPSLSLSPSIGTLSTDRRVLLGYDSRHIESVAFKVLPLTNEDFVDYDRRMRQGKWSGWPSDERSAAKTITKNIQLDHQGQYGWASTELDLEKLLKQFTGPVLVEVQPVSLLARADGRAVPPAVRAVYQVSNLNISGAVSLPRHAIMVTEGLDNTAVRGARVELLDYGTERVGKVVKTNSAGIAVLPANDEAYKSKWVRVSTKGDQRLARLPDIGELGHDRTTELRRGERVLSSVTVERGVYRPGEKIYALGYAAIASVYEESGLRPLPKGASVLLTLYDNRGETIEQRTVHTRRSGKFWATLRIPKTASLGTYRVEATTLNGSASVSAKVKEFRTPEFEVEASVDKADVHHGEKVEFSANANYYFGGAVPFTAADFVTVCNPTGYRPPGLPGHWLAGAGEWPEKYRWGYGMGIPPRVRISPGTERPGHLETTVERDQELDMLPHACTSSVSLRDMSNEAVGAEAGFMLHPPFYVATSPATSGEAPHTVEMKGRTLDFDGEAYEGTDIKVQLTRRYSVDEFDTIDGKKVWVGYRSKTKELPACTMKRRGGDDRSCTFDALPFGRYEVRVTARKSGSKKYAAVVEDYFWVSDPRRAWRGARKRPSNLTLDVGNGTLAVGETTEVIVRAPHSQGPGMLVSLAGGVRTIHPFTLEDGTATIPLEVQEGWVPSVELWALAVRPGTAHRNADLLRAQANLTIGTEHRRLKVDVTAPQDAGPGEPLKIAVGVRDHAGAGIPAHVTLWAVDEAVLSLEPREIPDFVSNFAKPRGVVASLVDSLVDMRLPFVRRPDPHVPYIWDPRGLDGIIGGYGAGSGYGSGSGAGFGGKGKGGGGGAAPAARKRFETTPIFVGDVMTDEDGLAIVTGRLPDNLTTFRITAIASAGLEGESDLPGRFGHSDTRVRVSKPLIARPITPRSMRPGDRSEMSVIVENRTASKAPIMVRLQSIGDEGLLSIDGVSERQLQIEPGGQGLASFTIDADAVGTGKLRATATMADTKQSDIVELELPVLPEPTQVERVAVYGNIDSSQPVIALPFVLPEDSRPDFGGLSVSMSSTLLGKVEDAAHYLIRYPHGCIEQTSSRLMPLAALGDIARVYPLGVEVDDLVAVGVQRISSMQTSDGGFGYWPGATTSAPYSTFYATWVLLRAKAAGYSIPGDVMERAIAYVEHEVQEWSIRVAPPASYDVRVSMGLVVLADAGKLEPSSLTNIWERRKRLPIFARALLLTAMAKQDPIANKERIQTLIKEIKPSIDERNDSARVETSGALYRHYFDTDARSTAMLLIALLEAEPDNRLVPKLARGLLALQDSGRWSNTQENAYGVLAMADYADVYEAEEPNFKAALWLGQERVVADEFVGRDFKTRDHEVAMPILSSASKAAGGDPIVMEKDGPGRLYYRVGLEWAPSTPSPDPKDEGIVLSRSLRDESGPIGDTLPPGEVLALDVTIEVRSDLTHVAIDVPLPSGVEGINLDLGRGAAARKISGRRGHWVSHQEIRTERVLIYADDLAPGVHHTTVFVRPIVPGTYDWPAARAEMMYYPEVYGRTGAGKVTVAKQAATPARSTKPSRP